MMTSDEVQELFERHRDDVYRTTRRILRNDADALDATQATFLNALQALPSLKEADKFPGWLRRIAVNVALGMRRSRVSERAYGAASRAPESAPTLSSADYEVLKRAVNELPEEYRLPIVLHHSEGLSYEEISRIMECPRGTVGTNIHRGLERLRTALAGSFAASEEVLIALLEGPPPPPWPPDSAYA